MKPRPLIAVFAGGRSRRMGADKALLLIQGTSWLDKIILEAQQTGYPVAVVGRAAPPGAAVPFVPDEAPGLGPIGGLLTALRYHGGPVLAAACDMPFLTAAAFAWLLQQAGDHAGPCGLAVRSVGGLEPLFSYYTPACVPLLEARVAAGRRSLRDVIVAPAFRIISAPEDVNEALRNLNAPEERIRFGL